MCTYKENTVIFAGKERRKSMKDFLRILSDQLSEVKSVDTSAWISRKPEEQIDLDSRLAQIVIGVRRSGKSTLCLKRLIESGRNFAYVNFDDERLYRLGSDELDGVLSTLYRIYGDFSHLFMDEVQNVEGWHLFVNRLLRQGIKIVLTGSNSNLLSGELSTHLTGRYNQIELMPLSLSELCRLNNVDTTSMSTKQAALRMRLLDIYMQKGGLPEVNLGIATDSYIPSLIRAMIQKDVCTRYSVRYPETLWQIANLLLDNVAQETPIRQITKRMDISSPHTVKKYVDYLTNAYLICPIQKFSYKSIIRQSASKIYAIDPAFVNMRGNTIKRDNTGWIFENIVYIELRRRYHYETQSIYYMRQDNFEVDFVVVEGTQVAELIQVTYDFASPTAKQYRREVGGLIEGSRLTGCHNLTLIIGMGETTEITDSDEIIKVYRASDWL